ncbi:Aspartate--tRNA ligase [Tetrabaena socialis]|uniref:Aspartate--tRNA ligase n=1 Tax=Tetrabaena socialis TaxID=47790 RepID=A0A2J7ZV92_9CHLO|nr:Aspartate--tRNA ligase [Tetrabaena socialis]|eukprot:PNH04193.1 Aspartate--tRNA ligase [Tetrabaena socialis]
MAFTTRAPSASARRGAAHNAAQFSIGPAPRAPVPSARSSASLQPISAFCVLPLPAAASSRSPVIARSSLAASPEAAAGEQQHAGSAGESVMSSQLTWPSRSHGCGAVTAGDIGAQVTICGWVDRNRDMGGMQFFDVRDHTGLLQAIHHPFTAPRPDDWATGDFTNARALAYDLVYNGVEVRQGAPASVAAKQLEELHVVSTAPAPGQQ